MADYKIGQRWLSEMEPELGLGIITRVSVRRIHIHFPASETEREYAVATAPIKRLKFNIGDEIKTSDGTKVRVTAIAEEKGLLTYTCGNTRVPEQELDSVLSFSSPVERLFGGFYDTNALYDLRVRALHWRAHHRASPAFGFIGARMDLIPHQLYVAGQVASRPAPRVLLSDQVGLGKTIEACLIMHRLLLSRRIERVLIIVPETLVHQWFIELLRRFNLLFRILDADYVAALLDADKQRNPFSEEQLMLCSLDFLVAEKSLHPDLLTAGWDMVIIDEAHHLTEGTAEYNIVSQLAGQTPGLMLLTATPEQLGHRSHFARLKLLDPSRYSDYEAFLKETEQYQSIARIANKLLSDDALDAADNKLLKMFLTASGGKKSKTEIGIDLHSQDRLVEQLIDRYGVGRVMFRNTRAAIPHFPKRIFHPVQLTVSESQKKALIDEFKSDLESNDKPQSFDYKSDPRLMWLLKFLKSHSSKILLICSSIEKTRAIEAALQHHTSTKYALFHEEMTLLQRDRNAAWFAEKEGAQLLLCSEIGSEGRNFQFAHHLVLFDVPIDPELLEQRIGRLDRIGQKSSINIWAPVAAGSPQEKLIRWYHEGFNAFETNAIAAYQIYENFKERLLTAIESADDVQFSSLIAETKIFNEHMSAELEKGRNRLLELNSFRKEEAKELIRLIKKLDSSVQFRTFMLDLLQHFEVQVDELSQDVYYLKTDYLTDHQVPLPPFRADGLPMTFSRKIAVAREDIEFISADHPTAMGSIDLLLGSEQGNAVFALLPDTSSQELLLEAYFVLECVAPARLHIDRFFPAIPLRIVVNHAAENRTEAYSSELLAQKLKNAVDAAMLENPTIRQRIVPQMVRHCRSQVEEEARVLIAERRDQAGDVLSREISRLRALQKMNAAISANEIEILEKERDDILAAIDSARVRLDAVRFIIRGEF